MNEKHNEGYIVWSVMSIMLEPSFLGRLVLGVSYRSGGKSKVRSHVHAQPSEILVKIIVIFNAEF